MSAHICPKCGHPQFYEGQHSDKDPCTHYVERLQAECGCTGVKAVKAVCQACFGTGFHRRAHESLPCPNGCASKLKPCPFCGSAEPLLDCLTDDDEYFVHCPSCNVQQIANHTREDAISEWNRRARV